MPQTWRGSPYPLSLTLLTPSPLSLTLLTPSPLSLSQATDETFLGKLDQRCAGIHPHYESRALKALRSDQTLDRDQFRLIHYAGNVSFEIENIRQHPSPPPAGDLQCGGVPGEEQRPALQGSLPVHVCLRETSPQDTLPRRSEVTSPLTRQLCFKNTYGIWFYSRCVVRCQATLSYRRSRDR